MTHYTLGIMTVYCLLCTLLLVIGWRCVWSACGAVIRAGEYAPVCEVIIWVDGNE